MSLESRFEEIYERGLADNGASLSASEYPYFLVWSFIISYETDGLPEYFFSLLHDESQSFQKLITSFEELRLLELARLIKRAGQLFDDYNENSPLESWEVLLEKYDPDGLVLQTEKEIALLDNYGLIS